MYLKLSTAAGMALALAACSSAEEVPEVAPGDRLVACAVGGAANLREACAIERSEAQGKPTLVVHHPDGAFRRFDIVADGPDLVVTDGAEQAETRLAEGKLDVTVAADRYVIPVQDLTDAQP